MRSRLRHCSGFTLIEFLVVLAIWGIIISILLPALVASREASRRLTCANNLKQLSLAIHSYLTTHATLPAGSYNDTGPVSNTPDGFKVGWIVSILPFFEQNGLAKALDTRTGSFSPENLTVFSTSITTLLCPADPTTGLARWNSGAGRTGGRSSYAASQNDIEAPIDVDNHGMFYLNSHIRIVDVEDGLSQTLLIGEVPRTSALIWISGTRATLRNTGHPINRVEQSSVLLADGKPADLPETIKGASLEEGIESGALSVSPLFVGGFGSYHPRGANFAFGDGSVRFIKAGIETSVYRRLGHRADGEPIDDGAF